VIVFGVTAGAALRGDVLAADAATNASVATAAAAATPNVVNHFRDMKPPSS
jgi:hypothetical protein